MKVLVAQSCPTLCDSVDCSPPGSAVYGILQARVLELLPFLSPRDLSDPGIEPRSPALQADSLPSEPPRKPTVEYIRKKLGQSFFGFCKHDFTF